MECVIGSTKNSGTRPDLPVHGTWNDLLYTAGAL